MAKQQKHNSQNIYRLFVEGQKTKPKSIHCKTYKIISPILHLGKYGCMRFKTISYPIQNAKQKTLSGLLISLTINDYCSSAEPS